MKYCVDCKYCNNDFVPLCTHREVPEEECVSPKRKYPFCATERLFPVPFIWFDGSCGRRGRFFEPK